jgi:hypothetical protein
MRLQEITSPKLIFLLEAVLDEFAVAEEYGSFYSTHEGYAVMLEEFEELWDAIKANKDGAMHLEAIQMAATVMRFLVDCCDVELLRVILEQKRRNKEIFGEKK